MNHAHVVFNNRSEKKSGKSRVDGSKIFSWDTNSNSTPVCVPEKYFWSVRVRVFEILISRGKLLFLKKKVFLTITLTKVTPSQNATSRYCVIIIEYWYLKKFFCMQYRD